MIDNWSWMNILSLAFVNYLRPRMLVFPFGLLYFFVSGVVDKDTISQHSGQTLGMREGIYSGRPRLISNEKMRNNNRSCLAESAK